MHTEELVRIVQSIWDNVLGSSIVETKPAEFHGGAAHLTACVQFTGAWRGAVTASCSEALAGSIASAMFGSEEGASREEMLDAFGEIVNMLGGNLKALLPPPCQLSLPAITDGSSFLIPNTETLNRVGFEHEGHALVVCLLQERGGSAGT